MVNFQKKIEFVYLNFGKCKGCIIEFCLFVLGLQFTVSDVYSWYSISI